MTRKTSKMIATDASSLLREIKEVRGDVKVAIATLNSVLSVLDRAKRVAASALTQREE